MSGLNPKVELQHSAAVMLYDISHCGIVKHLNKLHETATLNGEK